MQVEKCDLCGKLAAALHVCRLCSRRVCEEHFKPREGMCSQCYGRLVLAEPHTMEDARRSAVALRLFVLGFLLVFAGVLVLVVAALLGGEESVSGAAIVVVWFIPIVFGAGPYAFASVLLAVVLAIVAFAVFVWLRRQAVKG